MLKVDVKQLLLPSPIVKMDNVIARASLPAGGQAELDLMMHVAAKIKTTDEDFQTYTFPTAELGYGERLDGRAYKRLKAALANLANSSIKIEGVNGSYAFYSIFSMCSYENGTIKVRFDKDLKPFFLNLSAHFTSFELFQLTLLPSEYSKRLFILLKSYASLDTRVISLDELHDKLRTPESTRQDFAQFRLRVLNKAQKDLGNTLIFDWEPIKEGRSIIAIRFIFNKAQVYKNKKALEAAVQEKKRKDENKAFYTAVQCAKKKYEKDGSCTKQDNKKKICTLCTKMALVDDIATQTQRKLTPSG